jgi:acyl-CoA thioesterase FadM
VVYLHAKYEKPILNDKKVTARTRFVTDTGTYLTLRSKLKVKGHQQWYAIHRLEVVYLHAKYEKPVLNDKKVTARTRFVMDAQTSLTLRSKFKVKGHQQWYVKHRLEVVYLHAKYEKPVLNDKKVTAQTRFVMDAWTSLTLRSKFKVKGHQQWYATHRLEVVYLHAKYEKPVLNDKKVTAQTRFVMDAWTSLTLRSDFKVKGHQQWYATHCLEVVYLHAKYEKPVLNDKKVTVRTQFVMDARTSLTLRSNFKVKGHQQWYTTHHLEVVYLHAKYAKPVLNNKKVTAQTRFFMDARTDRLITIGRPPQSGGTLITVKPTLVTTPIKQ